MSDSVVLKPMIRLMQTTESITIKINERLLCANVDDNLKNSALCTLNSKILA